MLEWGGGCVGWVAPLAGAWFEMDNVQVATLYKTVAPLAGAWIEIRSRSVVKLDENVAPLAGAWIEIHR